MNVQTWLNQAKTKISPLDAELILCHVLGASDRSFLAIHEQMSPRQAKTADRLLARRANDEPLAYLIGYKEFYGRNFKVTKNTLIPRPESESIIRLALELNFHNVLDLGTGSACLIITLAAESPNAASIHFTASDKSSSALKVAQTNARNLLDDPHKINFLKSDLLQNIPDPAQFDLIIANLPYVDKNWAFLTRPALAYEPKLALYAPDHGLALIKKLIDQIKQNKLHPFLILEADPCQHAAIEKYIGQKAIKKDSYALLFKC